MVKKFRRLVQKAFPSSSTGKRLEAYRQTETVEPLPAPELVPLLQSGQILADRFEILGTLGVGGYGVVYRARDRQLGVEVALKALRADRFGPTALKRFHREARLAREIVCPQLVRVFDLGEDPTTSFLTMELVEGESLKERLSRGPLEISETIRLVGEVLRGLLFLHERGVIHRDVKPGNILLSDSGEVRLADFGLARHFDGDQSRATATSALVGTVEYLSPEVALGRDATPRSDLYSLGVVLFECLTGDLPHLGNSRLGTLYEHVHYDAEDVRRRRPEVPAWLAQMTARLLEREPERRYQDAKSVIDALRRRRAKLSRRQTVQILTFLMLLVASVFGVVMLQDEGAVLEPQIDRLAVDESRTILRAYQGDEIVWERNDVLSFYPRPVALYPDQPRSVVAMFGKRTNPSAERVVHLLDAHDGQTLHRRTMSDPLELLKKFGIGDFFDIGFNVVDFNNDGLEEILLRYPHRGTWPSYTVLWEPQIDRNRVLFVAGGFSFYAGSADVDGDGQDEALFYGTANRMGWMRSLAAVKIDPWVDDVQPDRSLSMTTTPGELVTKQRVEGHLRRLVWHALIPSDVPDCTDQICIDIEKTDKVVRIRRDDETFVEVNFEGFLVDPNFDLNNFDERGKSRRRAELRLINSIRSLGVADWDEALKEIRAGQEHAREAADDLLFEWLQRYEARILVESGEPVKGWDLYHDVMRRNPVHSANIIYESAQAFHRSGYLEIAADWYEYGLSDNRLGRFKWEFFLGLTFAVSELEDWERAERALERYAVAVSHPGLVDYCRAYLRRQRSFFPILSDELAAEIDRYPHRTSRGVDFQRYLRLEALAYDAEFSSDLIPEVEFEMIQMSEEYQSLIRSLYAELLTREGHHEEAAATARESLTMLRQALREFPGARPHYEMVVQRFSKIARRVGLDQEAEEAEAAFESWRLEQKARAGLYTDLSVDL